MHECARLNCHDLLWITGGQYAQSHQIIKTSVDHLEIAEDVLHATIKPKKNEHASDVA
jgi:hypothetical protein